MMLRGLQSQTPRSFGSVSTKTPFRCAFSTHAKAASLASFQPYEAKENKPETLIETMLPEDHRKPLVLSMSLPNGLDLYIGASSTLNKSRPGNGGFRLMEYATPEKCKAECVGLAQGMEVKHSIFNTGFSGAKVVCDASNVSGGVESIDKSELMDATSSLLRSLDGAMYTGCDMNTTLDDMEYLADKCNYVLAAIQNPDVDPNACTAFGVVGAIEAAVGDVKGRTLVIHGCGNVGNTVAAEMARCGATVYCYDITAERAEIPGCINISPGTKGAEEHPHWWRIPCDALVPCSKSGLLTSDIVSDLDTSVIVGATNLPFNSSEAHRHAESRGIEYIPEGVSSAGAVIIDSVEHFSQDLFIASDPELLYRFVRDVVHDKTEILLGRSSKGDSGEDLSTVAAIRNMSSLTCEDEKPVGEHFSTWCVKELTRCVEHTPRKRPTMAQRQLQRPMSTSSSGAPSLRKFSTSAAAVTEDDGKHTPYGEDGSGFYSEATKGCYDVIANAKPMVIEALDRALAARRATGAAAQNAVFTVADFGTADAGTSMPLMRDVVQAIRAAEGPMTPIVVAYEDQTENDWNSVFRRVHGILQGADASFMDAGDPRVFAHAVGTSFYQPCFPAGTLDLAFSATAMHWLSTAPGSIPDALHSACTQDAAALAAYEAQAARDWQHIMEQREKELKAGGQIVLVNFAKDEDGQFLGRSVRMEESMHHTFSDIWKELVTPEEFLATNFPNQYRSLEATVAPFGTAIPSLQVVHAKTELVECPFYNSFNQKRAGYEFLNDPAGHAANYVPTTRTWSNSTFLAGLSKTRPLRERQALVDELFARYEARVATQPGHHAMDYTHAYVHCEKPLP